MKKKAGAIQHLPPVCADSVQQNNHAFSRLSRNKPAMQGCAAGTGKFHKLNRQIGGRFSYFAVTWSNKNVSLMPSEQNKSKSSCNYSDASKLQQFSFGFQLRKNLTTKTQRHEEKLCEVWSFKNTNVKTYLELNNPPKEKIEAVKAMNLRNKLNKKSAEILATKYFKMLGHKEENFHSLDFYPPEVTQGYWVSAPESPPINERLLPYFAVTWYRKDVKVDEIKDGDSNFREATIEVSGVDLGLISYTKTLLPIGSDF
jgi:hypothetical protein